MSTTAPTAAKEVRRHPIRGALWGLLLGIGIAIYAVLFALIPFGDWLPLLLLVLAGVGIGLLWAYFAPAKEPKDGPPEPDEADDASDVAAAETGIETGTDEIDESPGTDETDAAEDAAEDSIDDLGDGGAGGGDED